MNDLLNKIQSLRQQVGGDYIKPDPIRVATFCIDLKSTPHAMDYLQVSRGINLETIEHFKLGYDKTKDAISIPIYKRGELINIKYRLLAEDAKIKYVQEKGAEVWLFNEDGIDKGQAKGGVLIVEGEKTVMGFGSNYSTVSPEFISLTTMTNQEKELASTLLKELEQKNLLRYSIQMK